MARSAKSAVSSDAASLPEKPASTTRFRPWPRTSTQPAATTSAMPATAMRARYGHRKRSTRASCRMSRLGGRSGMLSMSRAKRRSSCQALIQRRDPVPHRQLGAALKVRETADVGGEDLLGRACGERRKLVPLEPRGQLGLKDRIRAGGTAAQMRIGHRRQLESRARENALGDAPRVLPVLQGARRMKGDPPAYSAGKRLDARVLRIDHLADIARHRTDFLRLPGVRRIVSKQVCVLLYDHPAAARGHDDRFHAVFDV